MIENEVAALMALRVYDQNIDFDDNLPFDPETEQRNNGTTEQRGQVLPFAPNQVICRDGQTTAH